MQGERVIFGLYIGTPTYDLPSKMKAQCDGLLNFAKVEFDTLDLTSSPKDRQDKCYEEFMNQTEEKFRKADVILVSGGNSLFAFDRWVKLDIVRFFRQALEDRKVFCGGRYDC